MAQVTRKLPWHRRLSLRWALVFTTLLCALAGFLLLALETAVLEEARDAIYYKYITPYYAEESETGEYYAISPDGTTLYIEATKPYSYIDPDTGEIYPIETTPTTQFIPAGPLRFFYGNVGEIAVCVFIATAVLAFFADAWWVSATMYLVGIVLVLLGALLVKRITGQKYRKSFFIIELPEYKLPSLKRACMSMLERGKAYIIKAGTIILVCNTVVQIMQSFNWQFQLVAEGAEDTSILAGIAHPISILFIPLGFGVWQLAAAAVTGFIAKENVVGTLAVVYGVTNLIDTDELALVGSGNEVATIMGLTKVAALAYLMFNLYTPPCFAALGAMNSEMKSGRWLLGGICLQLATGYTVAFAVYQVGTLVTTGSLGTAFVPGLIAVLVFAAIIIWRIRRSDREFAAEYSLHTA